MAQNDSFATNWMLRSVVPHSAQAGFCSMAVIWAALAAVTFRCGFWNCGWLRMLNASARTSRRARSLKLKIRDTPALSLN